MTLVFGLNDWVTENLIKILRLKMEYCYFSRVWNPCNLRRERYPMDWIQKTKHWSRTILIYIFLRPLNVSNSIAMFLTSLASCRCFAYHWFNQGEFFESFPFKRLIFWLEMCFFYECAFWAEEMLYCLFLTAGFKAVFKADIWIRFIVKQKLDIISY